MNLFDKADLYSLKTIPSLIKPVTGMRSEYIRFVYNQDDLKRYIQNIDSIKDSSTSFLVEDIVAGHEIDIDVVVYDKKMMYAEVSDNFPTYRPYALETGHLMPSILSNDMQNEIKKHACNAIIGLGHESGIFDVEMLLTDNYSLELIKVNARVGDMYIPRWHKIIYGVDLIKAALAIAGGIDPKHFLQKQVAQISLAQLCITSNNQKNYTSIINNLK